MNTRLAIGVIVAVAIAIGIAAALSYENISDTTDVSENKENEPTVTGGKNLTLELHESVGITQNP